VRGIADEHHATVVPIIDVHPLHGRAMDLIIALQRVQILLHGLAKRCKAAAKSLKTTIEWFVNS
jgi:hypothetical protein